MTGSPGGAYIIMKHSRERRAKLSPAELEAADRVLTAQMKRDARWLWFVWFPLMIAPLILLGWWLGWR